MGREWKPGDVAMWEHRGDRELVFRFLGGFDCDIPEWQTVEGGCGYPREGELHRVVVIDPEDDAQVERLVRLFWDNGNDDCDDPAAMRAALREFADPKPPKPTEPTGFGAVVEDTEGHYWINTHPGDPNPWVRNAGDEWVSYDRIAAVYVLRTGVSA